MASGDRRVGGLELRLSGSAVDVLRGGCATWVPASWSSPPISTSTPAPSSCCAL